MASNRIKTGDRVRVAEGHDEHGGKVGTVQERKRCPQGKEAFAIKDDKGNIFTASKNELINL